MNENQNQPKTRILCQCLGGSHLYGLNTSTSDEDVRFVFCHLEPRYIVGLDRYEHVDKKDGVDEFGFEVRHYLNLLRKSNTQVMELLYNDGDWISISSEFRLLQGMRDQLINSDYLYKSLKGYIFGERRLANGERTGNLGSKRQEAIQKYGFSYKNFVQLLRLGYVGKVFFRDGYYPVNILKDNQAFGKLLLDIKTNPGSYTRDQLNRMVDDSEKELDSAYNATTLKLKFNADKANGYLTELYRQILNSL